MKHTGIYIGALAALVVPAVLLAGESGSSSTLRTLMSIEEQSKIFELLSSWSVLTIAFVTSAMVWLGGRQMHGGVFGKVLTLFSVGMTFVFLSAVAEIPWFQNFSFLYLKMLHNLLYIIGFVFIGLAAAKLLKVIKGE